MAFGKVSGAMAAAVSVTGAVFLLLVVSQISTLDRPSEMLSEVYRHHQHHVAVHHAGRIAAHNNQQKIINSAVVSDESTLRPNARKDIRHDLPKSRSPTAHIDASASNAPTLTFSHVGLGEHKKKASCFAAGTLVRMASGSYRRIESLRPGDLIYGGRVLTTMKRQMPEDDLFDYGGVVVRGDHSVFERKRGIWSLVRDSVLATAVDPWSLPMLASGDGAVLYDIIATGYRMHTKGGHIFADHMIFPETLNDKAAMLNVLNHEIAPSEMAATAYVHKTAGEYGLEAEDALASCFAGWTEVVMLDGSRRRIESLRPGDETKGGKVITVRVHELGTAVGRFFKYGETVVSGNHPVWEEGRWLLVRQSKLARPMVAGTADDEEGVVGYDLFTMNSTIYTSDGGVFADSSELLTEENEDDLLRRLNEQERAASGQGLGVAGTCRENASTSELASSSTPTSSFSLSDARAPSNTGRLHAEGLSQGS